VFIDTPVSGNRSEACLTDHGQMDGAPRARTGIGWIQHPG
jgi:hypothetical protein